MHGSPVVTVAPRQDASYKARTPEHWQCTTADTQATSEHYMAQQSQKLTLVMILDALVLPLDARTTDDATVPHGFVNLWLRRQE